MADARVLTFSEVKRLPRRVSSGIPVCMEERYPLGTFDKGSNTKYMDSYFIVQEYVLDGGNVVTARCELNHNRLMPDDWYCADGEVRDDNEH